VTGDPTSAAISVVGTLFDEPVEALVDAENTRYDVAPAVAGSVADVDEPSLPSSAL
jgi:hypothetical protein